MDKNLEIIVESIKEKKGKDILILDFEGTSSVFDYVLLCSGNSNRNIKAIADEVRKKQELSGEIVRRIEGYKQGEWVLMDYSSIIVHILSEEKREFYKLEELWNNAKIIHRS